MNDQPDGPREQLLEATLEYIAEHGVADLSLRKLATTIGTSHRMLIYHFGSKEGLLVELVRAVEDDQRAALAELERDLEAGHLTAATLTRRMWRRLAEPSMWPRERLFFELYGQALQRNPRVQPLLEGIVESWLEPLTKLLRRQGFTPARAAAQARLGVAVVRGLLLDLLTTGDRKAVDRAMEHYIRSFENLRTSGHPRTSTR